MMVVQLSSLMGWMKSLTEMRERITHQIVGFTNDYPKARVIVTSRVIGYRRKILTDAGFTHFTLQDLDEKQVETFVIVGTIWR